MRGTSGITHLCYFISYTLILIISSAKGVAILHERMLVIGDLHLSDSYTGKHINYAEDCIEVLTELTKIIKDNHVTVIGLLGDIFGVRNAERTLKTREMLIFVWSTFAEWNRLTNNRVYTVRGNHDSGAKMGDFDASLSLGYLKHTKSLTFWKTRIHFVDYGKIKEPIDSIDGTGSTNIVLAHDDIYLPGKTSWFFASDDFVDASTLHNLYGVDMLIDGHIHSPSPEYTDFYIDDAPCTLFYPGCPLRPRKETSIWDLVNLPLLDIDSESDVCNVTMIPMKLKKWSDIFANTVDEFDVTEDVSGDESLDIDALRSIIDEIGQFRFDGQNDPISQLQRYAGIAPDVKDLAVKYIEAAMNN